MSPAAGRHYRGVGKPKSKWTKCDNCDFVRHEDGFDIYLCKINPDAAKVKRRYQQIVIVEADDDWLARENGEPLSACPPMSEPEYFKAWCRLKQLGVI